MYCKVTRIICLLLYAHCAYAEDLPAHPSSWLIPASLQFRHTGHERRVVRAASHAFSSYRPPTLTEDLDLNVYLPCNSFYNLTCSINASPAPNYEWELASSGKPFEYHAANENRTIGIQTGMSTLQRAAFRCTGRNILGAVSTRKVIVHQVPEFTENTIECRSNLMSEGGRAIVICEVRFNLGKYYALEHFCVRIGADVHNVSRSEGRFSVIRNPSKPTLHINGLSVNEVASGLRVTFMSHSVVDGTLRKTALPPLQAIDRITGFIDTPGETVVVQKGARVELPCNVIGVPVKMIHWSYNASNVQIINGNLVIESVTFSQASKYTCSYPNSPTTATYTLFVREPIAVTVRPTHLAVDYNDTVVLTCEITGYPVEKKYWLYNGREIASESHVNQMMHRLVLKRPLFDISHVGTYQCVAENYDRDGTVLDNAVATATLLLRDMKPILVRQSPPVDHSLQLDSPKSRLRLECAFASNPPVDITWYLDDRPLNNSSVATFQMLPPRPGSLYQTVGRLTIDLDRGLRSDEDFVLYSGEYRADGTNKLGTVNCTSIVFARSDRLAIRKMENQTAVVGENFLMKCYTLGNRRPPIRWLRHMPDGSVQMVPTNHRHSMSDDHREFWIKPVQVEDAGLYECSARTSLQDRSESIKESTYVSVLSPPILGFDSPSRIVEQPGEILSYPCNYKVADQPVFLWWEFQPMDSKHIIQLVPDSPDNVFFVEYAQQKSAWYSGELPHGVPEFLRAYANSTVSARGENMTRQRHQGNLTCVARNKVGEDRHTVEITFPPELQFDLKPPNRLELIEGESKLINCTADQSKIATAVTWVFQPGDLPLDQLDIEQRQRIKQLPNGTLSLSHVRSRDPKTFLCVLTQIGKSKVSTKDQKKQSSALNLDIKVPITLTPMEDQDRLRGTPVELNCTAKGEELGRRVFWQFLPDGAAPDAWVDISATECWIDVAAINPYCQTSPQIAQHVAHFQSRSEEKSLLLHVLYLELSTLTRAHMGRYRCRAGNKYNRRADGNRVLVEQSMKLTVIGPPSPVPVNQTATVIRAQSISLSWREPEDLGNKPLQSYQIRIGVEPEVREFTLPPGKRNHTIEDLRPFCEYEVVLLAENSAGLSQPTKLQIRTNEAPPEGPVSWLGCFSESSDKVEVKWAAVAADKQNGMITHYWLCWQPMEHLMQSALDQLEWLSQEKEVAEINSLTVRTSGVSPIVTFDEIKCTMLASAARSYRIGGLSTFSWYAMRVVAVNNEGASPPSICRNHTLQDLPEAAPLNVRCSRGDRFLVVDWALPPLDKLNGVIVGYQIEYFRAGDEGDSPVIHAARSKSGPVKLDDLQPFSNYSIRVYVENSRGRGPPSVPVHCVTKQAKPSEPRGARATVVSATSVIVSWLPPAQPNGRIGTYQVYKRIRHENLDTAIHRIPPIVNDTQLHKYENLQPGPQYSFHVRACNDVGCSEAATDLVQTSFDPLPAIYSIGFTKTLLVGERLLLECGHTGVEKTVWEPNHSGSHHLLDGQLTITEVEQKHAGTYVCRVGSSHIEYEVIVLDRRGHPPLRPVLRLSASSSHSLQLSWTSARSDEVNGYRLDWHNQQTQVSGSETFEAHVRDFFHDRLTCATALDYTLVAINEFGQSPTHSQQFSTLGSGPRLNDGNDGTRLAYCPPGASTYVLFNMSDFLTNACPPDNYNLRITSSAASRRRSKRAIAPKSIFSSNLGPDDLVALDANRPQERWYLNVSGLHAASPYAYTMVVVNPAGDQTYHGSFQTSQTGAHPSMGNDHGGYSVTWHRWSYVFIPVCVVLLLCMLLTVSFVMWWRHKRLNDHLQSSTKQKTPPGRVVLPYDPRTGRPIVQPQAYQRHNSHSVHRYATHSGAHPYVETVDAGQRKTFGGLGRRLKQWLHLSDRLAKAHAVNGDEADRLSIDTMDSQGKINPYATYATTGENCYSNPSAPNTAPPGHHMNGDPFMTASGYHYSNIDTSLTLGRPVIRMQSSQARVAPTPAGPSTVLAILDRSAVAPAPNATMAQRRRVNSMESLNLSAHYHRGFAGDEERTVLLYDGQVTTDNARGSDHTAYRGSLLSSTTASSNHEELMQAYEFGRRVGTSNQMIQRMGPSQYAYVGTGFRRQMSSGSNYVIKSRRPGAPYPHFMCEYSGEGGVMGDMYSNAERPIPIRGQRSRQMPLPDIPMQESVEFVGRPVAPRSVEQRRRQLSVNPEQNASTAEQRGLLDGEAGGAEDEEDESVYTKEFVLV